MQLEKPIAGNGRRGAIRGTGWAVFSALSLGGMGVAAYLTYLHWSGADAAFCTVDSGCETVNRSGYSTLGPVPVALLGSLLYGALLAVGLGGLTARAWATPLAAGLALFGLAFSGYLAYAEVVILQAICVWCLASLAIVSALFLLSTAQVWLHTLTREPAVTARRMKQAAEQP